MREIRPSGSVRGVRSDPYPYRDNISADAVGGVTLLHWQNAWRWAETLDVLTRLPATLRAQLLDVAGSVGGFFETPVQFHGQRMEDGHSLRRRRVFWITGNLVRDVGLAFGCLGQNDPAQQPKTLMPELVCPAVGKLPFVGGNLRRQTEGCFAAGRILA